MTDKASTSPINLSGPVTDVYLLGDLVDQIVGMKLPSRRQALGLMLYTIRTKLLTVREGARIAVRDVLLFWKAARIPTSADHRCLQKLVQLYLEYRLICKSAKPNQTARKEAVFSEKLDDLFDIASQDALKTIECEEDKNFLLQQREKGRPGHMANVTEEFAKEMERRMKHAKVGRTQKMIYTKKKPREPSKCPSFSLLVLP